MSRVGFAHLGSGTVPFTINQISEGNLAVRDGEPIVIINPEDFSVYRDGVTKHVAIYANVVTRLDTTLENRRAIAIGNLSTTTTLFIGFNSSVATSGPNGGHPIFPQTAVSFNSTNRLHYYGIAGASLSGTVTEVA